MVEKLYWYTVYEHFTENLRCEHFGEILLQE